MASGRGKCGICEKKIKKDELQVNAIGWKKYFYKDSSRVHYSCIANESMNLLNELKNNLNKKNEK
jgi:hypothetical protein